MTEPEQPGTSAAARIKVALGRIETALAGFETRGGETGAAAALEAENAALKRRLAELEAGDDGTTGVDAGVNADINDMVDRLAGRLDAAIGKLDTVLRA